MSIPASIMSLVILFIQRFALCLSVYMRVKIATKKQVDQRRLTLQTNQMAWSMAIRLSIRTAIVDRSWNCRILFVMLLANTFAFENLLRIVFNLIFIS